MTDRPNCPNCGADLPTGSARACCPRCLSLTASGPLAYRCRGSRSSLVGVPGILRRTLHRISMCLIVLGALTALSSLISRDPEAVGTHDVNPGAAEAGSGSGREPGLTDGPHSEATAKLFVEGQTLVRPGPTVVLTVGFSEQGRLALALEANGNLRSWNLSDGSPGRTLALGGRSILGAAGTENWGRLAAVYGDNLLRTWDTVTGVKLSSQAVTCVPLNAYPNPFVAVNADGSSAAYINTCNDVMILNIADSTKGASWRTPDRMIASALAFSADGGLLVLGKASADPGANVIEVWQAATGRLVRRMAGHRGEVLAVDVSPDGRRVLSTGKDATLRVWEIATGREVAQHGLLPGAGIDIARSRCGELALVCTGHRWSGDGWVLAQSYGVQVWDLQNGRLIGQFRTDGPVRAVGISHDDRYAKSAGEDGSVNLWPVPWGPPAENGGRDGHAD